MISQSPPAPSHQLIKVGSWIFVEPFSWRWSDGLNSHDIYLVNPLAECFIPNCWWELGVGKSHLPPPLFLHATDYSGHWSWYTHALHRHFSIFLLGTMTILILNSLCLSSKPENFWLCCSQIDGEIHLFPSSTPSILLKILICFKKNPFSMSSNGYLYTAVFMYTSSF